MIKRFGLLIGFALALTLFVAPAGAATTGVFNPGNVSVNDFDGGDFSFNFGNVAVNTVYSGLIGRNVGESFTDTYLFTFNPVLSAASTVSVLLGGTGFSALSWSWIDPSATTQNGPIPIVSGGVVQASNNLTFPLLFNGTGTYVLQLVGTTVGQGGFYSFDLETSQVPLPPALLLFGSVLAGGLGLMRSRRKAIAAI